MSHDQIAFKNKQLASLRARPEQCESTVEAIKLIEADLRALNGNADDPRDAEICRLNARLAEKEAEAAAAIATRAPDLEVIRKAEAHDLVVAELASVKAELEAARSKPAEVAITRKIAKSAAKPAAKATKKTAAKKPK